MATLWQYGNILLSRNSRTKLVSSDDTSGADDCCCPDDFEPGYCTGWEETEQVYLYDSVAYDCAVSTNQIDPADYKYRSCDNPQFNIDVTDYLIRRDDQTNALTGEVFEFEYAELNLSSEFTPAYVGRSGLSLPFTFEALALRPWTTPPSQETKNAVLGTVTQPTPNTIRIDAQTDFRGVCWHTGFDDLGCSPYVPPFDDCQGYIYDGGPRSPWIDLWFRSNWCPDPRQAPTGRLRLILATEQCTTITLPCRTPQLVDVDLPLDGTYLCTGGFPQFTWYRFSPQKVRCDTLSGNACCARWEGDYSYDVSLDGGPAAPGTWQTRTATVSFAFFDVGAGYPLLRLIGLPYLAGYLDTSATNITCRIDGLNFSWPFLMDSNCANATQFGGTFPRMQATVTPV